MAIIRSQSWFRANAKNSRQRRPGLRRFKPAFDILEDRRLLAATHNVPADFPTIQAAVIGSAAGDTIKVAAGIYFESVTVDKQLTIIGAQTSNTQTRIIDAVHESILDVPSNSAGFDLMANGIVIKGFTIEPDDFVLDNRRRGHQHARGLLWREDLRQHSVRQYDWAVSEQQRCQGNNRHGQQLPLGNNLPGASSGNAIYSDQGLHHAEITKNFFNDDVNAAVLLAGGSRAFSDLSFHSDVEVEDNVMNHDGPIIFVNTTHSEIERNRITNPNGSGIFFAGAVTNTEVDGNIMQGFVAGPLANATFTGINLRTDPADYNVAEFPAGNALPNSKNEIEHNTVSGFGDSGIRLRDGAHDNEVESNTVRNNGSDPATTEGDGISIEDSYSNEIEGNTATGNLRDGIHLSNAQINSVKKNTLTSNGEDGIRLTDGSTGNTISSNTARSNVRDGIRVDDIASINNAITSNQATKNGEFDYFDATAGSFPNGTANNYKKNKGTTQNRPGLIS